MPQFTTEDFTTTLSVIPTRETQNVEWNNAYSTPNYITTITRQPKSTDSLMTQSDIFPSSSSSLTLPSTTDVKFEFISTDFDGVNWNESRRLCEESGMQLVLVKDEDTLERLTDFLIKNRL